jgi:glyoxylase I family protein
MSLEDLLLQLEQRFLDPEHRRQPTQLSGLLEDSFVEHGSSGRIFTKPEALALMSSDRAERTFAIEDFRVRELAPGCALATFRLLTNGAYSLRSSIWRQHGGTWKMAFHQGTPCSP